MPAARPFFDAGSLLAYRYANNLTNLNSQLASVYSLFPNNGVNVFSYDGIDGYSTALLLNSSGFAQDPDAAKNTTRHAWSGADNPNHFYTTQELFNESETAPFTSAASLPTIPTFTKRLLTLSTNLDSYNRNTFYRLLSRSAPTPPWSRRAS